MWVCLYVFIYTSVNVCLSMTTVATPLPRACVCMHSFFYISIHVRLYKHSCGACASHRRVNVHVYIYGMHAHIHVCLSPWGKLRVPIIWVYQTCKCTFTCLMFTWVYIYMSDACIRKQILICSLHPCVYVCYVYECKFDPDSMCSLLYVCVCVCVCIYVCAYVCIVPNFQTPWFAQQARIHMYVCVCTHTHMCICEFTYV